MTKEAGDIIRIRFNDRIMVELEDVYDYVDMFRRLSGGRKMKVIIDALDIFMDATPEAKRYFGAHPDMLRYRSCDIILINSLPLRLIARFYIKWDKKSDHLARIFGSNEAAMVWIEELRSAERDETIVAS